LDALSRLIASCFQLSRLVRRLGQISLYGFGFRPVGVEGCRTDGTGSVRVPAAR